MTNQRIAELFLHIVDLLERQGASLHRVRAWRAAAGAIRAHPRALAEVLADEGRRGRPDAPAHAQLPPSGIGSGSV